MAKLTQCHLRALLGMSSPLGPPAALAHLHQLPPWTRCFTLGGWSLTQNSHRSLGRILSTHSGSSELFHSRILLLPDKDRAIIVMADRGGKSGRQATANTLQHILATMILTLPRPPPPPRRILYERNLDEAAADKYRASCVSPRQQSLPPIPLLFGAGFSSSTFFLCSTIDTSCGASS
eukprot:CAMPEP_0197298650 /NCGR_PEP_ID=MMETSP0890-20130614/44036_1 /TAXON_ID=44058 ORGANISM="Aureoumbra lagunensis, Strain CCMP1510" /NCGR_SAMPLE_ID=MMETSP0890 /ASSEMBLY_ACC=CAM_ASM_000533 /LENGTH=177 /DNA_ID=CAMNT_0042776523 /DNA_START=194 /DNA_END=723 /DNA_ORIENTATION=-